MQSTIKYLVEDNGEVKKFNGTSWVSVGSMPATESMFLTDGMTDLSVIDNAAIQALVSDTPKLLMYHDNPSKTSALATLIAVPHGQLILQEGDMDVSGGVQSLSIAATSTGVSMLKIIISTDSGVTWKTFDGNAWSAIVPNASSVKSNGMTPSVINGLTKDQIDVLLNGSNTLRFAYYLEQDQIVDVVNVDSITITANPVATETPSLDSIKITYDELTIEGRMQDLERVNAINMQKLQFKANTIMKSHAYKLHDLVIDTFEVDSMETLDSSINDTQIKDMSTPEILGNGYISKVSLSEFKSINGVTLS